MFAGVGGANKLSGCGRENNGNELYHSSDGMERYRTQIFLAIRDLDFVFYHCNKLWKIFEFHRLCLREIQIREYFFPPGATQPIVGVYFTALYRALASSRTRLLDHTQRRTTVGRTPLNG